MNLLTSAVAAVIADPAGRVLLCQHTQGRHLWGLPGGRIRDNESPLHAAVRDIREEVGADVTLLDLVGLYHLTDAPDCPQETGLPDVTVHVFRARLDGEAIVNLPGQIAHLGWHDPKALPTPLTAVAQAAIEDGIEGRAGVLRTVCRTTIPDVPEATDADAAMAAARP